MTVGPGPKVPRLTVPPTVMMTLASTLIPTDVTAKRLGSEWFDDKS